MKKVSAFIFLFVVVSIAKPTHAQNKMADSLKKLLVAQKEDTNKLKILFQLSDIATADEMLNYSEQALELAKKINYPKGIVDATIGIGLSHRMQGDIHQAMEFYSTALKKAEEIKYNSGIGDIYNNIGAIYRQQSNYQKALDYFQKSLEIREKEDNKKDIALSLSSLGLVYRQLGNYANALYYFQKGLSIQELEKDSSGIASSIYNMSMVYYAQGDISKALKNYYRSLKIWETLGDDKGMAYAYSNIGTVYLQRGDTAKAIENMTHSVNIWQKIGDKRGISSSLFSLNVLNVQCSLNNKLPKEQRDSLLRKSISSIKSNLKIAEEMGQQNIVITVFQLTGKLYEKLGKQDSSLLYYRKAKTICEQTNAKQYFSIVYEELGTLFLKEKKLDSALYYGNLSFASGKEIGIPIDIGNASKLLSEVYEEKSALSEVSFPKQAEYLKAALLYHKTFKQMSDSLVNIQNQKNTVRQMIKYEDDKKEMVDKLQQETKDAVAAAEKRKQQIILYSVIGGLGVVLLFALFIYRSLLQIRKKNKLITEQKKRIEEKQKEILDSIRYAKRIQDALLPTEKYIAKTLRRLMKQ